MTEKLQELTQKEQELFNTLVKLGDDKELAFNTVIAERQRQEALERNKGFYRYAYES